MSKAMATLVLSEMYLQGYDDQEIKEALIEKGLRLHGKREVTISAIRKAKRKLDKQWLQEAQDNTADRTTQHEKEIALVKKKLHIQGDYRTLATYLQMESKLLGLNKPTEQTHNYQGQLTVSLEQRVAALQLADKTDPIDIVDGVVVSIPDENEEN